MASTDIPDRWKEPRPPTRLTEANWGGQSAGRKTHSISEPTELMLCKINEFHIEVL
jgi:hypothetical protein